MVEHGILLHVLQNMFLLLTGPLYGLTDILRPRACEVNVKESYSRDCPVKFSIPYRCCLGPILHSCYGSTFREVIPHYTGILGYADDNALKIHLNHMLVITTGNIMLHP